MKDRFRAAAVHFVICLLIAFAVLLLVYWGWYQQALADIQQVGTVVLILLTADVSLGPLLTFAVYNKAKKSLKMDLTLIGLCQLVFLGYGLYTIEAGRPQFLVFATDHFEAVSKTDWPQVDSSKKAEVAQTVNWLGPKFVGMKMPQDPSQRSLLESTLQLTGGVGKFPEYYVPYEDVRSAISISLKPLEKALELNPQSKDMLSSKFARLAANTQDLGYLPIRGRFESAIAVIRRSDAQIVALIAGQTEPQN
jgi:hypothetical protein